MQANRGGEASTSSSAPIQEGESVPGLQSQSDSARDHTAAAEDPAWLSLPAVHYALMQGNQQPCFRLATGQPDTRHWVAWEVSRAPYSSRPQGQALLYGRFMGGALSLSPDS